jgi:peptidyl-prolyl cis-trans isomerase B (cyclophilin B)
MNNASFFEGGPTMVRAVKASVIFFIFNGLLCLPLSSWGQGAKTKATTKAAGQNPRVQLAISVRTLQKGKTSDKALGTIEIELQAQKAPKTVANFVQYVKDGHYDGTIFHRVIENFMIQGGGFEAEYPKGATTPTIKEKTTRSPIQNEADNGLKNTLGTVAMARTPDPHSASAQFFINVKDNPFLDFKGKNPSSWGYCVFGQVTQGMNVVEQIKKMPTGAKGPFTSDVPVNEVVMTKATLLVGAAAPKGPGRKARSAAKANPASASPEKKP